MSAQMQLAFGKPQTARRKPSVNYFLTVAATPEDLTRYIAIATHQDSMVLAVYQYAKRPLSPSQVARRLEELGVKILLTSVRRSVSTLTREGLLQKLPALTAGIFGRFEHTWSLA
jgi:hypothetical protein